MMLPYRYAFIAALLLPLTLAACEDEGPMEEAGEQADEAVEETGEAVEGVGEEVEERDN